VAPASSLDRFREAQASSRNGIETALAELRSGGKRGHWIWYVFPQLRGLGVSPTAVAYGLDGADEAAEYLRDPQLRERLIAVTRAVAEQLGAGRVSLERLMGSAIDARKLVSSLTLFRHVAARLQDGADTPAYAQLTPLADDVLARAAAEGYPPCAYTLSQITFPSEPDA
jgi:uncharacterized protein (DUF1810 family)